MKTFELKIPGAVIDRAADMVLSCDLDTGEVTVGLRDYERLDIALTARGMQWCPAWQTTAA